MELSLRARVRAGDPDAFGTLYDECARAVYNHAFRLTGNWSAAEEVVSLTFLEAWRLRGRVEPDGGPLRPWLLGIAGNVARNLSRAASRHRAAMARLPPPPAVPDFADELAGRLDDEARLRELSEARPGRSASRSGPCARGCRGRGESCGRSLRNRNRARTAARNLSGGCRQVTV